MPFVVDNAVVCDGSLSNQSTGYTDTIVRRLLDDTAVTPALWLLELALRLQCPVATQDAALADAAWAAGLGVVA